MIGACGHLTTDALAVYNLAKGLGGLEIWCGKCRDWVVLRRTATWDDILEHMKDPDYLTPKRRPNKKLVVSDDQMDIPPF